MKERVEESYVALVLPPAVPRSTHLHQARRGPLPPPCPRGNCGAGIVLQPTLTME